MLESRRVAVRYLEKGKGFNLLTAARLRCAVGEFDPHVIHTHSTVLPYLLAATWGRRAPILLHTVHSLAENETRGISRRLQALAFRRGVVPVAIAEAVAKSIGRVYCVENALTIPNGIPVKTIESFSDDRGPVRSREGINKRNVVFISVARLEAVKAPDVLLRAFTSIAHKHPNAKLWFVGSGSLRHSLQMNVNASGFQDRVKFFGARGDVYSLLAASDVFTLPSHYEGNPLCVMEAMAAGRPVIASNVGGIPELVQEGIHGKLIVPGDPNTLADAMNMFVVDPLLREKIGAASHARAAASFDAKQMVKAYEDLYEQLVADAVEPQEIAMKA
ncbi:MAG: glycosyltransferase [Terracidiphilus sp.]